MQELHADRPIFGIRYVQYSMQVLQYMRHATCMLQQADAAFVLGYRTGVSTDNRMRDAISVTIQTWVPARSDTCYSMRQAAGHFITQARLCELCDGASPTCNPAQALSSCLETLPYRRPSSSPVDESSSSALGWMVPMLSQASSAGNNAPPSCILPLACTEGSSEPATHGREARNCGSSIEDKGI